MVFPTWEELVPHFRAEGYRVLAVRMDPETTGDAAQPVHGFAVHSLADASEVPLEKLATVPITALLDGAGRVRWIEYGTLSAERTAELVSLLDR